MMGRPYATGKAWAIISLGNGMTCACMLSVGVSIIIETPTESVINVVA